MEPRERPVEDHLANLELAGILDTPLVPEPETKTAPPSNRPFTKPLGVTDVFVDNFIQLGQGGPNA